MPLSRWSEAFYRSTRGRIVRLLRRQARTVDQLAEALGVTPNGVRAHLATLERDGLVEPHVLRRSGVGKPARAYAVAAEAEALFSQAYAPVLTNLLDVLHTRLPRDELTTVVRETGDRLAAAYPTMGGTEQARAEAGAALLDRLGGITEVTRTDDGALAIRGYGCPLALAVRRHPELCGAVGSLLERMLETPVRVRCEHGPRPSCRLELGARRDSADTGSRSG